MQVDYCTAFYDSVICAVSLLFCSLCHCVMNKDFVVLQSFSVRYLYGRYFTPFLVTAFIRTFLNYILCKSSICKVITELLYVSAQIVEGHY